MPHATPDPRTRYFMGWEPTIATMRRENEAAEADGVYLEHVLHIWPTMSFRADDPRWKHPDAEVELYALCGERLRTYLSKFNGQPVEYGDHWNDGSHDLCTTCEAKWGVATYTPPPERPVRPQVDLGNLFVALHTGDPGASGDAHEVSGGGYARQPITFDPDTASMSYVSNNKPEFPNMPECGLTHFTIHNVIGQKIFSGTLTQSKKVPKGSTASFAIGSIRVTL